MKKRIAQIATGIIFAGMLVLTGCGSTQTTGTEAAKTSSAETEVVEEVEVSVEETEVSSLTETEKYKTVTQYTTFEDFEKSLGDDKMVAYIYSRGYKGAVLLVADKEVVYDREDFTKDPAKNYCNEARFYTVVDGVVRCIGRLNPMGSAGDISVTDNGVIFATGNHKAYESYLVSADGMDIVHKDFLYFDSGWGYYTESNDLSQQVEFENDKYYMDKIENLRNNAKIVEFRAPIRD